VAGIPPMQWAGFDGSTRSAMIHYAKLRAAGTPIKTDDSTYYRLLKTSADDPAAFSETNMLQYRPYLSDSDWQQMVNLQGAIRKGDREAAGKVQDPFLSRSQLLEETLTLHGINPDAKPETPEGKAIAQLRRMVDRRVEVLQGGGKKATNQDIQAEIDGLLSQSVEVSGSWWNVWPGGKPGPWGTAQKRLLDLTISDIPARDRSQLEDALKSRNRPVSDAAILDLYLETQVRKGRR